METSAAARTEQFGVKLIKYFAEIVNDLAWLRPSCAWPVQ